MKKKVLWLSVGILSIILIAGYNHLGGFHEIEMEVVEIDHYHLIGNYYEGRYDRDSIATLFFNAKKFLDAKSYTGTLSVVNFLGDTEIEKGDTIQIFVGLILPKEPVEIPGLFDYRKVKGGKILRASIEAHSFVIPSRETIEGEMKEYALANDILLEPIIIEKYFSDEKLVIESIISF